MKRFALALFLTAPAWCQIVGYNSGQQVATGSTAPTVTLTGCSTNSATVLVAVISVINSGGPASIQTVSSTSISSANWTMVQSSAFGGYSQAILVGYSGSVSNSEVVTVGGSNIYYETLTTQCFSGLKTSGQPDKTATNTCGNGSIFLTSCQPSTSSVTPSQGGELIVAAQNGASGSTINSGFSYMASCASPVACIGTLIQTSPAAVNPTFTFPGGYISTLDSMVTLYAASPPTDYSAGGPGSGYVFAPSSVFTLTRSSGNFTGSTTVTVADGGKGGTVTAVSYCTGSGIAPVTLVPTGGQSTCTFTYAPAVTGAITLSFTGAGMSGQNPLGLAYTSNPSTIAMACLSGTGVLGAASGTCTVIVTGASFNGSRLVTLSDSGQTPGGTFTPSVGAPGTSTVTVAPASGSSFTFTYTPLGAVGVRILALTNSFAATNPANVTYTATSAEVDAYAAKANGSWNSNSTWTCTGACTHGYPQTGDSATITGWAVICSTGTCYVGSAPGNTTTYSLVIAQSGATWGSLEVASGATLWLTGNYQLNGSNGTTSGGKLILDTGATFVHDNNNSASVSYHGEAGLDNQMNLVQIGTPGDACAISGPYAYACPTNYEGVNVAGGVYPRLMAPASTSSVFSISAFGLAAKYCGTAAAPCIDESANGGGPAVTVDVEGSVFDTTSPFGNGVSNHNTTSTVKWVNNREVNDLAGFTAVDSANFLQALASCTIVGNFFDLEVGTTGNDPFGGCILTDNVFSHAFNGLGSSASPWGSFQRNLNIIVTGLGADKSPYVPVVNNIFYEDWPTNTGSNHIGYFSGTMSQTYIMAGNLCSVNSTTLVEGHCGGADNPHVTTPGKAIILDNLATMTAAGNVSGSWMSNLLSDAAGLSILTYMDHNGANGNAGAQSWGPIVGHGSTYYPTNAIWQTYRANIGWSPTTSNSNTQIRDLNQAASGIGTAPSTMVNASTVIDWNLSYNGTASSLFGNGVDSNCTTAASNPWYGQPYDICASSGSGPGAHETTVSPKYIDATRSPDMWAAKVMGQANSITGVRAAVWGCQNIPYCIGKMYAWIRQGLQPTNMALKGAAHDGKIIGFSGTYGSGYSGTCGVTITPRDAEDLGGSIPAYTASATCTFSGGVPVVTLASGGAHYRIATPAAVAITCGGCTPTVAASLTPIIQPSDIGPVPMVMLAGAY